MDCSVSNISSLGVWNAVLSAVLSAVSVGVACVSSVRAGELQAWFVVVDAAYGYEGACDGGAFGLGISTGAERPCRYSRA